MSQNMNFALESSEPEDRPLEGGIRADRGSLRGKNYEKVNK